VLDGEPTGIISSIDGAYFASGPDGTTKRAIILLTDIFGLPLKNSKILADNFALQLRCDVWVPDFFAGNPPASLAQMNSLPLPDRAGVKMSFSDKVKLVWTALPSIPNLFYFNRREVVDARTVSFVKKLQIEKNYEKLGAIGYCFGGGIAARVGASTDLFKSIVLVHPSNPTDDHIRAIKAPTAWACAEDDESIKPPRLEEIKALYESTKAKDTFEFKTYKGTAHGFGARPNFAYPDVKEAFQKAFIQAVDWFNKTIPA